ncbi:hypothetical protein G6F23_008624 [Rhizopus arrhizus]|nr:hypothetical protein G6F23_008624 [Rhizopus arrhizus]
MQSVFANLKKPKYKPVDIKALDEAISEAISREYNSSQTHNAMYQHNEFAGMNRGAIRGHDHYNQADVYGDSYTQGASGFGRGHSHYNQAYRNNEACAQGTPSFGRDCREFSNNTNVFVSTEPVVRNEYDGHASLNTDGPNKGFGALSNNTNTQGWYVQSDERQSHQPFVSRQSTLEEQNDNQDTPAISSFNKSRLSFDNNKGQRDFAQPSEGLSQAQSKNQVQNRSQVQNKPRKNISQVDAELKMYAQRRVQECYYSDWFMLDFKSTSLKRARIEDRYMVKEQKTLAEQRRLEHRRRLQEQRWLEEKQRLQEQQKIKEEIRLQAIKRRNERKQKRGERRRRLNRRMQQLEEKQKMMEERIRQLGNINEQKVGLLCESMSGPSYYVDSKTRIKKQFKLKNVLKKKAGVWLRRVHDKVTKRNTENHALERKRKLKWILMKNNPYLFSIKIVEYNKNSIWDAEDFGLEDSQVESSAWFKRGFNLADEFLRNVDRYATPSITSRMVIENTYPIIRPIPEEIGGIVFSIPEQKGTETSEEREAFWARYSCRLESLMKEINSFNPIASFPILLTYFPVPNETGWH